MTSTLFVNFDVFVCKYWLSLVFIRKNLFAKIADRLIDQDGATDQLVFCDRSSSNKLDQKSYKTNKYDKTVNNFEL